MEPISHRSSRTVVTAAQQSSCRTPGCLKLAGPSDLLTRPSHSWTRTSGKVDLTHTRTHTTLGRKVPNQAPGKEIATCHSRISLT